MSFAVEGAAHDDAVLLNALVANDTSSEVRLGAEGNSAPHVTIALGEAHGDDTARVVALVAHAVRELEPFTMTFGPVEREHVTGQYVLAGVVVEDAVRRWRSRLRDRIAQHLSGLGRMTEEPHLTLAVVEDSDDRRQAVDSLLDRARPEISGCEVTHVDVAHAGRRGIKGQLIRRFTLGSP